MGFHKTIPWKDWQWFSIASTHLCWSVKPDSPLKTFQDLIDSAKKAPGKVKMSNSGVGETWHEGALIMAKVAGVEFAYIPYKGGAPATLACLQGEVDVVGSGLHEHIEFIKAGKLRSLAVFTDKPITAEGTLFEPVTKYLPQLKNVPFGGSIMLAVKRDTPLDVLRTIQKAHLKAAEEPRFEEILKQKIIRDDAPGNCHGQVFPMCPDGGPYSCLDASHRLRLALHVSQERPGSHLASRRHRRADRFPCSCLFCHQQQPGRSL